MADDNNRVTLTIDGREVTVPRGTTVLEAAKYWKTHGMHIEITNLIIPYENDNPDEIREMCNGCGACVENCPVVIQSVPAG